MCCWRRLTLVVILLLAPVSASAIPLTIDDAIPGPGWAGVTIDPGDGTILFLGTFSRPPASDLTFVEPFSGIFSFNFVQIDAWFARWIDVNGAITPFLLDPCQLLPAPTCLFPAPFSLALTNAAVVDFSCGGGTAPEGCIGAALGLSNLQIEPIPEPTSGLLLLTGVAWAWRHRMRPRNERYRCPGAS